MNLISSRYSAARAAAVLYAATLCISQYGVDAFAPATVKGRESSVLNSSTASPEVMISKPTNNKKSSKQKSSKKKGSKRVYNAKNVQNKKKRAPKRKISKSPDVKTFKPLKDLKLGSKISGTVVDLCDFGAFINIGYATRGSRAGTALLHISQISDQKIHNIRDHFKIGDTIEGARVINIDLKKGEVGLSMRTRRPKRRDFTKFKLGSEVEGKVDSVLKYGVFVDVGANVNALLHISRITGGSIENIRHHLNEGDPVTVHVIDIDEKKKTLAVSMLDKKADQYLDRRMSQRLKKFYGTVKRDVKKSYVKKASSEANEEDTEDKSTDLEYFDIAIRELEEALRDRKE